MEFLENGMLLFAAGSDDEGTKIHSRMGDDENMNEGNCKGTFKDWVSAMVDGSIGCWAKTVGIGADVEVQV